MSNLTFLKTAGPGNPKSQGWRACACRIVEELFPSVDPKHWDLLLDLRQGISLGVDWREVLNLFQRCRYEMEVDAYLPFYRLRQLIAAGLQFQSKEGIPGLPSVALEDFLRGPYRSIESWQRELVRHWFELGVEEPLAKSVVIGISERSCSH